MPKRFNWDETRRYWESHTIARARVDPASDPDALDNVLHPGEPLWLNEYYARAQRAVFCRLLALVPAPQPGARALDVGCGAGRWSHLLGERGYAVTGIDLQKSLVAANRARMPAMRFEHTSLQEFAEGPDVEGAYSLVTSVTVIQHNPFEEQERMVRAIAHTLRDDGHVVILENLLVQSPHVFSRSVEGWQTLFFGAGLCCVAVRRYDYSPFSRAGAAVMHRLRWLSHRSRRLEEQAAAEPESYLTREPVRGSTGTRLRAMRREIRRACVALDDLSERCLMPLNLPRGAVHAGLLFARCPSARR
jgi:SAM-dependent methyltransferase